MNDDNGGRSSTKVQNALLKERNKMNLLKAYNFLNIITDGQSGYLEDYKKYIAAHQDRVSKTAAWFKENLPEIFNEVDIDCFNDIIDEHDASKYSEEEFEPYAEKWFNNGGKSLAYNLAWEHHWGNNEHHPEYWLGEDMPLIYILEMLADWGSFSIDKKDFRELSDFYYTKARDDEDKNLSDNTKKIIEEILAKIKLKTSEED